MVSSDGHKRIASELQKTGKRSVSQMTQEEKRKLDKAQ